MSAVVLTGTATEMEETVARMTGPQREERVTKLLRESREMLTAAIKRHVLDDDKDLTGIVVLYSGGNDSTVLAHIFKDIATHAAHANTGIGIEETRQFVRDTCATWDLPLIEKHPPQGSTFEELVIDHGFPGPAHHWKMYQRLKERCLRQVRAEFVTRPRRERVVFLAGRRRSESARRALIPESEREGSVVWVSPLINWTTMDLSTYRLMKAREGDEVPTNRVSSLIHMSGECLCGAFAKAGELDEIAYWFPEVGETVRALEEKVRAAGHPEQRCQWGWGAYRSDIKPSKSGPMCSSCDARQDIPT